MIKIQSIFPNIKEEELRKYKAHLAIGGKGRDNRLPLNMNLFGENLKNIKNFRIPQILSEDLSFL